MKKKTNTKAPVPSVELQTVKPKVRFTFRVTVHEQTYLLVGDVIEYLGRDHVVTSVSPSAARIVPVTEGTPKKVTFTPRFADKPVTFSAPERNTAVSISPNSELPIKRRLGVNWKTALGEMADSQ